VRQFRGDEGVAVAAASSAIARARHRSNTRSVDLFLLLVLSVVRLPLVGVVALGTTVCLSSASDVITSDQRADAIRRAQVWTRTNVRAVDIMAGPKRPDAFAPLSRVRCEYHEQDFAGATPKFGCTINNDDHVKVRYGRTNPEVFAGVAATRLLWALGFGADALYPVRVICSGCPKKVALADPESLVTGEAHFDYAAIERRMPGKELEAPSVGAGWSWPELDMIDEHAGGAPLAQRDALKLIAVMLQHTDSKPEQQKLLCVGDVAKKDLAKCPSTFMMIHDVGLTFGAATLMNRADVSGVNLEGWSSTPVWKDAARCIGNLPPSQTGTLSYPKISEPGRQFLASLLAQLSDAQIQNLFTAARFDRKPGQNGEGGGSIGDWVAAFKKKRDEIAAARCIG
jgi:hypothetical protein